MFIMKKYIWLPPKGLSNTTRNEEGLGAEKAVACPKGKPSPKLDLK
jgi:hypothetical protein